MHLYQGFARRAQSSASVIPERRTQPSRVDLRARSGGTEGNEVLTATTAAALTLLLLAEGVTILRLDGLRTLHMFLGLVLIPPIVLKLGSTAYRMVNYYAGSSPYRRKGPPALPMRLLAPVLAVTTISVFASGVWLLVLGHRSDAVLLLHKVSFIAWGAMFAIHVLVYFQRMLRSVAEGWGASGRPRVPGAGARAMLLAAALGGGLALALALLGTITSWHGGHHVG
jgi:hypothetical protein